MATLTFALNTGAVATSRILDGICLSHGYTGFLPDGVTPTTKAAFAQAVIADYIIRTVRDYERGSAASTAIAAVTDITLT